VRDPLWIAGIQDRQSIRLRQIDKRSTTGDARDLAADRGNRPNYQVWLRGRDAEFGVRRYRMGWQWRPPADAQQQAA